MYDTDYNGLWRAPVGANEATTWSDGKIPFNDLIVKVVFNGNITSISDSAFSGCTSLTSITIPDSVTSIGRYAFYGCKNLTGITILNPNCELTDDITNEFSGTIYGYKGSTAEAYANKYGYSFSALDTGSEPETDLPEAPAGSIYGDVDCDRDITLSDAQYVLTFYVERMTGNARSWREVMGSEKAPD